MPSNHTPGPWMAPHFVDDDVACNCKYVLCNSYMGAICTVYVAEGKNYGDDPPKDEASANAYLIAAAPDMYHAATKLLAVFDKLFLDMKIEGHPAARQLYVALRRAEGVNIDAK